MASLPAPGPALAALAGETRAGFEWLAAGLDPAVPVSFAPNPGNVGDAAINLACWRWLTERFREVEICPLYGPERRLPRHATVFVGGGGNFVEPLYQDVSKLLTELPLTHSVRLFPVTLYGYDRLLRRWDGRIKVICREAVSYRFARRHLSHRGVRLGHDAAFALAGALPGAAPAPAGAGAARFFRGDLESVAAAGANDGDPSAARISAWADPAATETALATMVATLARHSSIATDRLHVGILAALLGRQLELHPNSYFKNRAVFQRSLCRLPQSGFSGAPVRPSTAQNDPQLYRSERARTQRRRHLSRLWLGFGQPRIS